MQQMIGNTGLMVKKLAMLVTMLAAALVFASAASAQQGWETATVTFQLTIDGEVPEGRTFSLGYKPIEGYPNHKLQGVSFCTTDTEDPDFPDESTLPVCEDGGTYSGTLEVPTGVPFSYDLLYHADADDVRCDYIGPTEVFYSDTRTFTEDATVNATYVEDGLPPGCRAVGGDETEEPEQQPQCFLPEGCFLSGDASDEAIVGGIGPDYIIGGGGDDALHGLGGGDWLDGGAGDDLVRGNAGDDLVDGGSGHDLVRGNDGNDYVTGYLGNDILDAGGGSDYVYAADGEFDKVSGGPQYDVCVVDEDDDVRGCEEVHTG